MTAVIGVRVTGGIALAADDGSSVCIQGLRGREVAYQHRGARKLVPLATDPPIAAISCGAASVAGVPLVDLLRDAARDAGANATPLAVAEAVTRAVRHRVRQPALQAHNPKPDVSILITGYGLDTPLPDWHLVHCRGGHCHVPKAVDQRLWWGGDATDAITRLVTGLAGDAGAAMQPYLNDAALPGVLGKAIRDRCGWEPVHAEMPLADALALARFLLSTCRGMTRFGPGPDTLGPGTFTATINRHEGLLVDQRDITT